jgi:uncharacterized caspase-like protein
MERNLAALVIGNSSYVYAEPLRNPTNDAEDVSAKLVSLGFSVATLTNATSQQMEAAVQQFDQALQNSSVGLVCFSRGMPFRSTERTIWLPSTRRLPTN